MCVCGQRVMSPLGITTWFRPLHTLRQLLSRPKDPVDSTEKPGVVYRVPCSACSSSYIGQIGRTLAYRIKKHQAVVRNRDVTSSTLVEHWLNTGHVFSWDNATVVKPCRNWHLRRILEAWHIQSCRSALNRDPGTLPPQYNCLISGCCHGRDTPPRP